VTFVALSCPDYTDIFANKSRNDILESLKNLGPDSQYLNNNKLVNPDFESMPPQDRCPPITGWKFTLGTGIEGRAVTGVWGSLSKVTNPFDTSITTEDSTALLDQNAKQVDSETIGGATTVQLTNAERDQASNSGSLWAQGGVPDDSVLTSEFPGPQYGFGALRCATDDLNGDVGVAGRHRRLVIPLPRSASRSRIASKPRGRQEICVGGLQYRLTVVSGVSSDGCQFASGTRSPNAILNASSAAVQFRVLVQAGTALVTAR
jgi:hypothetical protein